ncbi:MAG: hypothetical protein JOZ90_06045 [Alphaproteobacteria bacterium]|nr:hypothetical protein [Alphaproteobacteria bacterium]MBV9370533.1 hypothetical protein [Alphaproteobacteria bacterium]MBV9900641.1 hypothetical protein [Alphaproteobacteria bacterium]
MTRLSLTRAWEESADFLKREGGTLYLIAFALMALPGAAWQFFAPPPTPGEAGSPVMALLVFPVLLLTMLGSLSITLLALGRENVVGASLALAARRLWPLLGAVLIAGLAAGLVAAPVFLFVTTHWVSARGLSLLLACLLLALLLVLWVKLLMATPVAAAERAGPIAILMRSWRLTAGHFATLLGFVGLVFVVLIVLGMAVGAVGGTLVVLLLGMPEPGSLSRLVILLMSGLLNAAFAVAFTVMVARLYAQLAGDASP